VAVIRPDRTLSSSAASTCLALAGRGTDACGLWEAMTRLAAEYPEITGPAEHGLKFGATVARHT
jgi:hypothetical protein